jgi:hypothetical protein
MRRLPVYLLLAVIVLPHEAAHAVPARLAGLDVEVTLLPEWDGPEVPLGRFDAALDQDTPLWLVRLIAIAPLPTYLSVAAGVGSVLPSDSSAVVLFPVLTYWATLSGGDIAVAADARTARDAGEFLVPRAAWSDQVMFALIPLNTLVVTVLLIG